MLYLHLPHHMTQHGTEAKLTVRGHNVFLPQRICPGLRPCIPEKTPVSCKPQSWFLYQSLNSALYFEINNSIFLSFQVALCVNS